MKIILALVLVLYSAAAFAQGSPPTVGEKPLVQVKPHKRLLQKTKRLLQKTKANRHPLPGN